MKVLFITENLAPFRVQWLDALAEHCEVKIMYLGHYDRNINAKFRDYQPQKAVAIPIGKKIGNIYYYDYKKILQEKADILLLDGYGFLAQVLLIELLKAKHRPFVLTVDGGFMPEQESAWKYRLKRSLISSAAAYLSTCKSMDSILIHYGADANHIFRHYFSSIHLADVISKPVTLEEKTKLRKKCLKKNPQKMIISVGQLIPRKGFDILIQALADVELNDVHLYIVGGKAPKELYELCHEKQVESRVHFIDFIEADKLKQYYLAADLFVLMTRSDVWGLVIGEAMANGLPVVTTDMCVAGIEMLSPQCIVKNEDAKAAASIITDILQNEQLQIQLSEQNLATVRKYAIEAAAKEDFISLKKIAEGLQ